jgi:hypothetical protein
VWSFFPVRLHTKDAVEKGSFAMAYVQVSKVRRLTPYLVIAVPMMVATGIRMRSALFRASRPVTPAHSSSSDAYDEQSPRLTLPVFPERTSTVEPMLGASAASTLRTSRSASAATNATPPDLLVDYDVAFAQDTPEPTRARIERATSDSMKEILPDGAELRSVECRAAMCRFETVHRSDTSFRDFTRKIIRFAPETLSTETYSQRVGASTDEAFVVVSYVARTGHELPRVE